MTSDEPSSRRRGRRKRPLIYPYATGPHSFVDSSGVETTFHGDTPEMYRDLYLEVSRNTLATFRQIWELAHMISYGPEARTDDGSWTTIPRELRKPFAQAKLDAAELELGDLPLQDAFDIWERARAHLRLLAEHLPDGDELLRQIAESERRVQESYARYEKRMQERKAAS
jgi:exonuclease VII small subunit